MIIASYQPKEYKVKSFGIFQRISKDVNIILDKANVHLVNKKIEQIKNIKDENGSLINNIIKNRNYTFYSFL